MNSKYQYIAIDIAKDSLQVKSDQHSLSISYDQSGLNQLLLLIQSHQNAFVICEATGGYERKLMAKLFANGIAVALVNPARVRAFASSEGIKAKTDPIDAKVLLRFAVEKKLRQTQPPGAIREQLVALLERHAHISEQIAREKNRLQNSSELMHASIQRMLSYAKEELTLIDTQIHDLLKADPLRQAQSEIMQQVTGIGEMTAWSILAYLPEITEVNRNKAVALAGLAPYNRDSGKKRAKRRIIGGRAKVRKCLYMATQSAAVHNPTIKTYVDHLRFDRGKSYKSAIVAAMRKMLIHLQVLLKNLQNELA